MCIPAPKLCRLVATSPKQQEEGFGIGDRMLRHSQQAWVLGQTSSTLASMTAVSRAEGRLKETTNGVGNEGFCGGLCTLFHRLEGKKNRLSRETSRLCSS